MPLLSRKVDESASALSAELAAAQADYRARRANVIDTASRKQEELQAAIAEFQQEVNEHSAVIERAKQG